MNMILNCCLALLVGNLGFRIWSYFVTMEAIRSVAKDVVKLQKACNDNQSEGLKYLDLITYLQTTVRLSEADVVAKNWELKRRFDEKLTKMEARLTLCKKKCAPHKPKEKEEDK